MGLAIISLYRRISLPADSLRAKFHCRSFYIRVRFVGWSVMLLSKLMKNGLLRILNDLDSAGRERKRDEKERGTSRRKERRGGKSDEEREKWKRMKDEKVSWGRIVDRLGLVFSTLRRIGDEIETGKAFVRNFAANGSGDRSAADVPIEPRSGGGDRGWLDW